MGYDYQEVITLSMPAVADPVFKSLADPTRRAIFERIASGGAQTVHALTRTSGVSQPAVSKHLAVLKSAGLVQDQRSGRETRYAARPEGLMPLVDWMSRYAGFWTERLDGLEDLLNRMEP